jgi:hypothetical protein
MHNGLRVLLLALFLPSSLYAQELATHSWRGVLRNDAGASVQTTTIHLAGENGEFVSGTSADGSFRFPDLAPGRYELDVVVDGIDYRYTEPLELSAESPPAVVILTRLGALSISFPTEEAAKTGGEKLYSQTVSAIPLNKRDFSQLLLLAAGTMTDANGQTNFTQQFAINGQRGVEAAFAMDGADTSDPEMGGATFSNFNVDAVEEIRSTSGWMPAEIGRGAARIDL